MKEYYYAGSQNNKVFSVAVKIVFLLELVLLFLVFFFQNTLALILFGLLLVPFKVSYFHYRYRIKIDNKRKTVNLNKSFGTITIPKDQLTEWGTLAYYSQGTKKQIFKDTDTVSKKIIKLLLSTFIFRRLIETDIKNYFLVFKLKKKITRYYPLYMQWSITDKFKGGDINTILRDIETQVGISPKRYETLDPGIIGEGIYFSLKKILLVLKLRLIEVLL